MQEISIIGLKGLYNRITVFSHMQKEDVIDVVASIEQPLSGYQLASNRAMLVSRIEKLIYTGRDQPKSEFFNVLNEHSGRISSKSEIESLKQHYIPEFNVGTDKIGVGYRRIANTVMLMCRAGKFIQSREDLMFYEFTEKLLFNSAEMRK